MSGPHIVEVFWSWKKDWETESTWPTREEAEQRVRELRGEVEGFEESDCLVRLDGANV